MRARELRPLQGTACGVCLEWPLLRLLEVRARRGSGRRGLAGPAGSRAAHGLGAGVGLAVARLQPLGGDVGVDLRGRGRGVAEDLLHAAQVGAALEQVRGGGVPDRVRARVPRRGRRGPAGLPRLGGRSRAWTMRRAVRGSSRPPRAPRKSAAPLRSLARTGRPASSQRASARIAGSPTGTTRSLPPLPRTRTVRRSWSRPADVELAQLADPDRGRVEQLEDRGVAHGQGRRGALAGRRTRAAPGPRSPRAPGSSRPCAAPAAAPAGPWGCRAAAPGRRRASPWRAAKAVKARAAAPRRASVARAAPAWCWSASQPRSVARSSAPGSSTP